MYTAILYKNFDIKKNFDFYKGSMLKFDNTPRRNKSSAIFQNYSPEQFYMLNKNIINWTRTQYNITKQFIKCQFPAAVLYRCGSVRLHHERR